MAKPEAPKDPSAGVGKSVGAFDKATGAAKSFGSALSKGVLGGVKAATPGIKGLGDTFKTLASADLPSATSAFSSLGGVMSSGIVAATEKLSDALAGLGPEGKAAGAAIEILGAAMAATVGTMMTLAGMAIDITQKIDLMRDRFAALAGSAAGGKEVQAMLGKLASSLPFAAAQVNEWGQGLLAAGVKGKQLEADIQAVAAATALMGEQGGAAAMTLFKRLGEGGPAADKLLKTFQTGGPKADKLLKEMGLSLADLGGKAAVAKMTSEQLHEALAKAMAKKGKGPLEDMALTLPAILQKAREGFMSLFAKLGPAVKPFMKAIKELFGNFNKGTPIIKTLQKIFTEVFGTIFKYATMAVKAISGLLKGGGAAKAIASAWGTFKSILGAIGKFLSPLAAMFMAIYHNAFLMNGIKSVFKAIGVVILVIIGIIGGVIVAFTAIVGVVGAVVGAVVGFIGGVIGVIADFVASVANLGSSIVDGLLNFDGSAFIAKMAGLASAGLDAFKSILGIASPSKVMAKMGGHMGAGLEGGLDKSAGGVADSAAELGGVAAGSAGKGAAGGAKGKGAGLTVNGGLHVHTTAGTAQGIAEEAMALILERLAASQGV